ncbi:MAG: hypothetical protein U0361_10030 [Nitrospiraceae bacterium]
MNILRDAMAVDSCDPCGIYFGTTGGQVYASANGGDSWAPIVGNLPGVLPSRSKPCDGCRNGRQRRFQSRLTATYPRGYASFASLPAALLNSHFEQPVPKRTLTFHL